MEERHVDGVPDRDKSHDCFKGDHDGTKRGSGGDRIRNGRIEPSTSDDLPPIFF